MERSGKYGPSGPALCALSSDLCVSQTALKLPDTRRGPKHAENFHFLTMAEIAQNSARGDDCASLLEMATYRSNALGAPAIRTSNMFVIALLLPTISSAFAEQSSPPTRRIIGGELAKPCAFPSVASLQLGQRSLCSATLVAPQVVFTAAHCLDIDTPSHVDFGENAHYPARRVEVERCKSHPHWKVVDNSVDMAYCVLKEEVRDIPITPILMGCELQALTPRAEIYLAGFGNSKPGEKVGVGEFGLKRFVKTQFVDIIDDAFYPVAILGSEGKQGCNGDSGGPAFVRLPPERFGEQAGWRVFGVTHGPWGASKGCTSGMGQYGMMHNWIADVERETGMDLTPCFDGHGAWDPGPECRAAPLQLATTAHGQWPDRCSAGQLTQAITSCAQPPKPEQPTDPKSDPEPGPESSSTSAGGESGSDPSSSAESSSGPGEIPTQSVGPDTTGPTIPGPAKSAGPRLNPTPSQGKKRGCELVDPGSMGLGAVFSLLALVGLRRRRHASIG